VARLAGSAARRPEPSPDCVSVGELEGRLAACASRADVRVMQAGLDAAQRTIMDHGIALGAVTSAWPAARNQLRSSVLCDHAAVPNRVRLMCASWGG
jgi:hypothetical protein